MHLFIGMKWWKKVESLMLMIIVFSPVCKAKTLSKQDQTMLLVYTIWTAFVLFQWIRIFYLLQSTERGGVKDRMSRMRGWSATLHTWCKQWREFNRCTTTISTLENEVPFRGIFNKPYGELLKQCQISKETCLLHHGHLSITVVTPCFPPCSDSHGFVQPILWDADQRCRAEDGSPCPS